MKLMSKPPHVFKTA